LSSSSLFANAFNFELKMKNSSNFAGTGIEVNKTMGLGSNGHIAIKTTIWKGRSITSRRRASKWMKPQQSTKHKEDRLIAIYLNNEIGGFAIHLFQK